MAASKSKFPPLIEDVPPPALLDNAAWLAEDKKSGPGKTVAKGKWRCSPAVVERVAEMMARRYTRNDIANWLYKQAGKDVGRKEGPFTDAWFYRPSSHEIAEVMSQARVLLLERLDLDKPYEKGTAVQFYESIIRSPVSTQAERIKAQERIDALLGLDAKYREQTDTADALARKLREALAAGESTMSGE